MWILPTLNRPLQCAAVLDQIIKTGCTTPGVVFVNGKENHKDYFDLLRYGKHLPKDWIIHLEEENIGALGALNKCLGMYPDEKFYGFIGDDEFVLTNEWDKKLVKAAGDWDVAHGDDDFNAGRRAQGYLCVGGKVARAIGYMAIPDAWHWYGLDDMWEQLAMARACKRVFLSDVKVEHKHPFHGKGEKDACYELGASRKNIDQQIFFGWLRYCIQDVIRRIESAKRNG